VVSTCLSGRYAVAAKSWATSAVDEPPMYLAATLVSGRQRSSSSVAWCDQPARIYEVSADGGSPRADAGQSAATA
jgi:hypothetical protein